MVTWNKMNIEIKVDDSYIGKTNGLCGFYDGQNDCNYLFIYLKNFQQIQILIQSINTKTSRSANARFFACN